MTHISRHKIAPQVSLSIEKYFTEVVSGLTTRREINGFFFDFFTMSEKVMFQKRLAIMIMILDEVPFTTIAEMLQVSPATISKIAKKLDRGGYRHIVGSLNKKKEVEQLSVLLEKIIRAGLPPRGRGRWNWLDKHTGKR